MSSCPSRTLEIAAAAAADGSGLRWRRESERDEQSSKASFPPRIGLYKNKKYDKH